MTYHFTHAIDKLFYLLLAVVLLGCSENVDPVGHGSLELSWEVSPRGCEAAGVVDVEVTLSNEHNTYEEVFTCDVQQASLPDIWPGHYELVLVGVNNNGRPTFSSRATSITIKGDGAPPVETFVRLSAKEASLDVEWVFENGRVCGANGVETVEVTIFDDADYEIASKTFQCNDGLGYFEGFTAGDYFVEASAISTSGGRTFRGSGDVTLERGDSELIKVVLQP